MDVIKREDAIKALRLEYPMMPMFKESQKEWAIKTEGYRKAEEVIKNIPSAENKGKWIMSDIQSKEDTDNGNYQYICSVCGHGDIHARTQEVPYCWWCGAHMKGADDE